MVLTGSYLLFVIECVIPSGQVPSNRAVLGCVPCSQRCRCADGVRVSETTVLCKDVRVYLTGSEESIFDWLPESG